MRWREAMAAALYGAGGFFTRPDAGPAGHFRTSATSGAPGFVAALLTLLHQLDAALGYPDPLDLVDIGAGRGELLSALGAAAGPELAARLRLAAVERAPAPDRLPGSIAWRATLPHPVTGLVLATEWLDNVPVDVAQVDPDGTVRYLLVDPATGAEAPDAAVTGTDAAWLARWWPLTVPGTRAEMGRPRDQAWAAAVATVDRGAALAIDYGHLASGRPPLGTLTGFRDGREVPPVPDGSCDLTAHVALDAAAAGWVEGSMDPGPGTPSAEVPVLVTQRTALRALGVTGARPPVAQAYRDPAGYLRGLAAASSTAELAEPAGLGGHYWLLQPVGVSLGLAATARP